MPESPPTSDSTPESRAAQGRPSAAAFVGHLDEWMVATTERLEALAAEIRQIKETLERGGRETEGERGRGRGGEGETNDSRPTPEISPSPPVSPSSPPDDAWQRAIFGPSLAADPALVFYRNELLRGVLQGEPAACSLAGQLLVFQAAAAEKKPTLLKEIGEAFYRWRPKRAAGRGDLEQALAGWLQEACQQAGAANTIELVEPGQRFDAARHSASQRGVEIAGVQGWVVLRDNGKVYTKAAVAVK